MTTTKTLATFYAFLAAVLYAISIPLSKLLLTNISPVFMAAFLYLGAGIGMSIISLLNKNKQTKSLSKDELGYVLAMIILDILAPISLMYGLMNSLAENAALLNNFEIVATTIIALTVFKEMVSIRLWIGIFLITLASIILSFSDLSSLKFSYGSLFVLLAAIFWGFENNCTRKLSSKNTFEIVIIKGIFSGLGSFLVALIMKEDFPQLSLILRVLLLGFISYGLSIYLYVKSQSILGAAKTSAYYAVSPFIGALIAQIIFKEHLGINFYLSAAIMAVATLIVVIDTFLIVHKHAHIHEKEYYVNGEKKVKTIMHVHKHYHISTRLALSENHETKIFNPEDIK